MSGHYVTWAESFGEAQLYVITCRPVVYTDESYMSRHYAWSWKVIGLNIQINVDLLQVDS